MEQISETFEGGHVIGTCDCQVCRAQSSGILRALGIQRDINTGDRHPKFKVTTYEGEARITYQLTERIEVAPAMDIDDKPKYELTDVKPKYVLKVTLPYEFLSGAVKGTITLESHDLQGTTQTEIQEEVTRLLGTIVMRDKFKGE